MWDSAPIVLEEHKLLFFTQAKVACTTFKQLFRRMSHLSDWEVHNGADLPHNPKLNGLSYLYHYSPQQAYQMMTSDGWTRAIFVRDPKRRVLSAYLDKAARKEGHFVRRHCCSRLPERLLNGTSVDACVAEASGSFRGFLDLISTKCCCNHHWVPQSYRIDPPELWKYINFVGHFENLEADAKLLLEKIDAWLSLIHI